MKTLSASLIVTLLAAVAAAQPDGGAPSRATPTGDDVDIARAHFNTGQAYYEHGRYADAAREFEEAYRLSSRPVLLYNMGKAYDAANDFARALDAYQRFLDAVTEESPDRTFADHRVELLKTLVGRVALDGAVDGSEVKLDGAAAGFTPLPAALVVNPGRHQLELVHEDYATFRTTVDVRVGGATHVAVEQTAKVKVVTVTKPLVGTQERPFYKNWWLWAGLGGVVVVAGVVTAIVLTTGSSGGSPSLQLPQVR